MRVEVPAVLEIDCERGVVYVHSQEHGGTLLQICQLPIPIPVPKYGEPLDITHMVGCSWREATPEPPPLTRRQRSALRGWEKRRRREKG